MNTQKNKTSADKAINLVIALIIIVVLVAGGWAVYQKISDNMLEKAITEGTAPQTVETYAAQAGQSVEEYLAACEITDPTVNGDTLMADLVDLISVKSYAKIMGMGYADFVAQQGIADKVTEDTMWTEAEKLIPLGIYIGGDDQVDMFKEYYSLDESVTAETPWGELADIIAEKDAQMMAEMEAAANATEAPADEAAADVAEGEAVEATEAPAAE